MLNRYECYFYFKKIGTFAAVKTIQGYDYS